MVRHPTGVDIRRPRTGQVDRLGDTHHRTGRGARAPGRTGSRSTIGFLTLRHPSVRARAARRLLEELGEAAVGQGLAAGLAGRAVLQARVGEADLADDVAADRALLTGAPVHGEVGLLLALQLTGRQPARPGDSVAELVLDGGVETVELLGRQAVGRLEGRHLRGVEDLVAVGVADPGDGALVAQDALDLCAAGVLEDAVEGV